MEPLTAVFPPRKGGGEGVADGGKGKGIWIHLLSDGNGMPIRVAAPSLSDEKLSIGLWETNKGFFGRKLSLFSERLCR
jgi:hypothetical protein